MPYSPFLVRELVFFYTPIRSNIEKQYYIVQRSYFNNAYNNYVQDNYTICYNKSLSYNSQVKEFKFIDESKKKPYISRGNSYPTYKVKKLDKYRVLSYKERKLKSKKDKLKKRRYKVSLELRDNF